MRFWLLGLWLLVQPAWAIKPQPPLKLSGEAVQGGLLLGQTYAGARVRVNGQPVPVDAAGRFLLGIGRDQQGRLRVEVLRDQQVLEQRELPIATREYAIQRIDGLPPKKVSPPPEVLERIRREARQVKKARADSAGRAWWQTGFLWPAKGPISGVYGSQRILNGQPKRPHYGVDIAAGEGAPVIAPADGRVRLAEPDLYYSGGTVIIDHGLGLSSSFLHLSQVAVEAGQFVHQGERIGAVGATGRATGPHLDWRMNWLDQRIDPQRVLQVLPARTREDEP